MRSGGADILISTSPRNSRLTAHYTLQTNYRSTDELRAVNAFPFAHSAHHLFIKTAFRFEAVKAKAKRPNFRLQGEAATALQCCFTLEGEVSGAAYQQRMAPAAAAQIHTWLTAAQDGQATLMVTHYDPMISRCWCAVGAKRQ